MSHSPSESPSPDLNQPDAWIDTYFDQWYARMFESESLRPLIGEEMALLRAFLPPAKKGPVLDLGCGFGRHLVELQAAGYEVIGLDRQRPYLLEARKAALRRDLDTTELIQGDMRALPLPDKSFSATFMMLNTLGPVGARAAWDQAVAGKRKTPMTPASDPNLGILHEVYRVLMPGGRLLIDLPDRRELLAIIRESPVMEETLGDLKVRQTFRFSEAAGVLHNETEFAQAGERHYRVYYYRVYTRGEIARLLSKAGLKVLTLEGEKEANLDSWQSRMFVVAGRPRSSD